MIDFFSGIICSFKLPENNVGNLLDKAEAAIKNVLKTEARPQLTKTGYSKELGIPDGVYRVEFCAYCGDEERLNSWDGQVIKRLGMTVKEIIGGEKIVIQKFGLCNLTVEPVDEWEYNENDLGLSF